MSINSVVTLETIRLQNELAEARAHIADLTGWQAEALIKDQSLLHMIETIDRILNRVGVHADNEEDLITRIYILAAKFDKGFEADVLEQARKRSSH